MGRTISEHLDARAAERRQRRKIAARHRAARYGATVLAAGILGLLVAHMAAKGIAQAAQDAARYDAGIRGDGKW